MSRRRRFYWALFATGVIVAASALWALRSRATWPEHQRAEKMPVPTHFEAINVREPSGIAYHPQRETLVVVSDEGGLVELDLQYKVIHRYALPGDLEGVAVHPVMGTVFVASESKGAILEYDLVKQCVLRRMAVVFSSHPDFAARRGWNQGLEGVTLAPNREGTLQLWAIVEARPARLIVLSADVSSEATEKARRLIQTNSVPLQETVHIIASYDLGLSRLSDVLYDTSSGLFMITSAGSRTLTLASVEGKRKRSIRLPGKKPEGFCFVPCGDAVVVQDTGGLWVCENLRPALFSTRDVRGNP